MQNSQRKKVVEKIIMEKISGMSTSEILKDCSDRSHCRGISEVYPFDLLVNIFCSFDKHFDIDDVKKMNFRNWEFLFYVFIECTIYTISWISRPI